MQLQWLLLKNGIPGGKMGTIGGVYIDPSDNTQRSNWMDLALPPRSLDDPELRSALWSIDPQMWKGLEEPESHKVNVPFRGLDYDMSDAARRISERTSSAQGLEDSSADLMMFTDPTLLSALGRAAIGKTGATALASYGQRKALARAVPEYSALLEENLGGITKNLGRIAKEKLADWGLSESPEYALGSAAASSAPEYRNLAHRALGKHGVVIPHVPKSTSEPLLVKTSGDVPQLFRDMLGDDPGSATAAGLYDSLWGKKGWSQYRSHNLWGKPMEGDLILSQIADQDTVIPHEFSHYVQDLIAQESGGKRPFTQTKKAQSDFYNKVFGNQPGRNYEEILKEEGPKQGMGAVADLYKEPARAMWENYPLKEKFAAPWRYRSDPELMKNEFTAELTNPAALTKRLPNYYPTWEKATGQREAIEKLSPELGAFWDMVPDYIPDNAYHVPSEAPINWTAFLQRQALERAMAELP